MRSQSLLEPPSGDSSLPSCNIRVGACGPLTARLQPSEGAYFLPYAATAAAPAAAASGSRYWPGAVGDDVLVELEDQLMPVGRFNSAMSSSAMPSRCFAGVGGSKRCPPCRGPALHLRDDTALVALPSVTDWVDGSANDFGFCPETRDDLKPDVLELANPSIVAHTLYPYPTLNS